jgi:hypothetical protein
MRVLCTVALTFISATASARPASTGWYAEGDVGAVKFLPSASADAALGPALDLRVGRDLFSWLSVGIMASASNHEATVPPPPTGQYFQLYRGEAELRVGGRFDSLALYAQGGVGAAAISSNVLGGVGITDPGEHFSIAFSGGAGAEYQLENRHYALGIGGDVFVLPQFATMKAIDMHFYLRYTY